MMNDQVLKYISYTPRLIHMLAMLIILLRYFYKIQFGLDMNKLLYLAIVLLNFSLENRGQSYDCFDESSLRRLILI